MSRSWTREIVKVRVMGDDKYIRYAAGFNKSLSRLVKARVEKEKIIHGDWTELERLLPEKLGFILGDRVFGNIAPLENYTQLLGSIHFE